MMLFSDYLNSQLLNPELLCGRVCWHEDINSIIIPLRKSILHHSPSNSRYYHYRSKR